MSLSLPELFSANHQVVEVLREAVSSTELLHERAMERFYRAVALEEAELAKKNENSTKSVEKRETSASPIDGSALSSSSARLRNTRLRRRPSSTGSPVQTTATRSSWNRRRSSEGQNSPSKIPRGLPATLLLPVPQLVASDPNLAKHESEIAESESRSDTSRLQADLENISGSERSKLHRWDDKSMPLIPSEYAEENETGSARLPDRFPGSMDKTPSKDEEEPKIHELSDEEIEDEELEEESDSSEDLKLLKSRILAQPVVDEEDTYHPRGRPTPHVPSPEPASPTTSEHRGPMTPNNVSQPPKSILKKRTEEEPLPVNRFGRPIPPEMPIAERQKKRTDDDEPEDIPVSSVTMRKRSLTSPEATRSPELSEMDRDNANLLSVAEVARSRRRLSAQKPQLPTKTSFEEEEDLQARMAVIDHYTEIVREYSMAHSVIPPYRRSNTLPMNAERRALTAYESIDKTEADRPSSVSPAPSFETEKETPTEKPASTLKKEDATSGRKNGVGSRGTTPARDITKTTMESRESRRMSRKESPAPRSRNVSTERPQTGGGSRSSSRTRKREVSQDRSSKTPRSSSKTRNRESSRDRAGSRSSSKTRIQREISQERPPSRLRKERSVSQSRPSSRASSKERHRAAVEPNPSDSEASSKISGRKKNDGKKLERSSRANSKIRRVSPVGTEARPSPEVDERLAADAVKKVRTTVSYVTDLTLLIAAIYVYLFKKEILAVPIIGLLLYRRIQEDIHGWIPKWWRTARKR